jgi:ribosomal protein L12E/L44/L45/RPP1/RPP2
VVLKKYSYISMAELLKYAGLAVTISGLIFQAGRQSERIDELFTKAHAAELERKDVKEVIYDMHGRICAIENDVKRLLK